MVLALQQFTAQGEQKRGFLRGPLYTLVIICAHDFLTSGSPGAAGPRRWPEGQLSPRAGSISPSQSAITQWGWDFHTARDGTDPGDLRFRLRVVAVVEIWRDFSSGDKPYPPRCGGTSTLPRGATLAARWLHEPQPISNQPEWGWGFHTLRGGIDPGDLHFRPRVVGVVDVRMDF